MNPLYLPGPQFAHRNGNLAGALLLSPQGWEPESRRVLCPQSGWFPDVTQSLLPQCTDGCESVHPLLLTGGGLWRLAAGAEPEITASAQAVKTAAL